MFNNYILCFNTFLNKTILAFFFFFKSLFTNLDSSQILKYRDIFCRNVNTDACATPGVGADYE